jgi:hypothetical protein
MANSPHKMPLPPGIHDAVPRPTYSLDNPADPWGQQQNKLLFGSPKEQVASWGNPNEDPKKMGGLKPIPDAMYADPDHPGWKSRTEAEGLREKAIGPRRTNPRAIRREPVSDLLGELNPDPGMPEFSPPGPSLNNELPELPPLPRVVDPWPDRPQMPPSALEELKNKHLGVAGSGSHLPTPIYDQWKKHVLTPWEEGKKRAEVTKERQRMEEDAHLRTMKDNPGLMRFHPDYGGVPNKGVPKSEWGSDPRHGVRKEFPPTTVEPFRK